MNKDGWDVSKAADSDHSSRVPPDQYIGTSCQKVHLLFSEGLKNFVSNLHSESCMDSRWQEFLVEREEGSGGLTLSDRLLGRVHLRHDGTRRLAWLS